MAEKTSRQMHTSTLQISDEDLQNSLKHFLEADEAKETPTIWNIRTISGLVLVFLTLAFIGQSIGTEILGTSGIPLLNTVMKVLPYLGGAMLGVICLGFLKQTKQEKREEKKQETQNRKTYDKLDDFLYSDRERTETGRKQSSTKKTKKSFRDKLSYQSGLVRSRTDKKLFGVCGGLAKYLGMNSTVLRIGFLLAFFLSSGSFFLLYFAMAFVMPKESVDEMDDFT